MDRRGFLSLLMVSPAFASSFTDFQTQVGKEYDKFKKELEEEFKEYKKILNEEYGVFKQRISQNWDEATISSRHTWVQYSKDLHTRSIVNFAENTLMVETLANKNMAVDVQIQRHLNHVVKQDIKSAIENDILLSNIEQRLLNLENIQPGNIPAGDSILGMAIESTHAFNSYSQIEHRGNNVRQIEPLVIALHEENILATAERGKNRQNNSGIISHHIKIKLPSSFLTKRANKQASIVLQRTGKYQVSFPTVMSVMHTESSFNPMALSESAYGLMMINPETSGREAHKKVYGKEKIITPTFLYNNVNNIELGSAYFNLLFYHYLDGIIDPVSRLYCTVAAYNAGLGNIARAFTGKPIIKKSFDAINTKKTDAVFKTLQDQLPFEESKIYLTKVKERIPLYQQ